MKLAYKTNIFSMLFQPSHRPCGCEEFWRDDLPSVVVFIVGISEARSTRVWAGAAAREQEPVWYRQERNNHSKIKNAWRKWGIE